MNWPVCRSHSLAVPSSEQLCTKSGTTSEVAQISSRYRQDSCNSGGEQEGQLWMVGEQHHAAHYQGRAFT